MDDEFEMGLELDRALRAAVAGAAQLMERGARVRAEADRTSAAAARQEWLAERDAARRQYEPWMRPGAVEKAPTALTALPVAQAWAAAAAWSEMDPTAALAERALAERISQAHGEHPSVLLQRATAAPGATLTKAPPVLVELDEQRAQWEAWASKVGAEEEFDVARWRDAEGTIDEAARDAALVRLWDAGSEDRALLELEEHQAAMTAAGMGDLPAHVALSDTAKEPQQARVVEDLAEVRKPDWAPLMTAETFEAAEPHEVARAWCEARTQGLYGAAPDLVAQAAAEQLAREIDRKYDQAPRDPAARDPRRAGLGPDRVQA